MAALGNRVSSLFDFTEKRLGVTGSSITSFACDPKHDDEPGRPGKKVFDKYHKMINFISTIFTHCIVSIFIFK